MYSNRVLEESHKVILVLQYVMCYIIFVLYLLTQTSNLIINHINKTHNMLYCTDGTTYDTVFQTTNGFALILRVYLPQDNNRAPSMTLHGVRASHNWLDIRMKVRGDRMISWIVRFVLCRVEMIMMYISYALSSLQRH